MTLEQLKRFIRISREREGVSWNLVDQSPLHHKGDMFTLYVFDHNDNLVQEIRHIEQREAGRVPADQINAIAEARGLAGIDPMFSRLKAKKGAIETATLFAQARQLWFDQGYFEFVSGSYELT